VVQEGKAPGLGNEGEGQGPVYRAGVADRKRLCLFQRFLPENRFTTRIAVIGDRVSAFIVRNEENDFRAYDMQKVDVDREKGRSQVRETGFEIL